jgi:hypothetical protein
MSIFRRRSSREKSEPGAGLVSSAEWRKPSVRFGFGSAHTILLVGLVILGLGPLIWLAKAAITPTNDTISHPMALFPHGAAWSNLREAWVNVDVGRYFWNTVVLAFGSWLTQIVVATTAGFALSVLHPRYARFLTWVVLATLFIPAVVLLVPLYIEIVHPPLIHHSFIDSYWAIWLPAGASAFNVIIVKRFFDNLPREIFDAARIDGGTIHALLEDRAAHVQADPGRRVGLRCPRIVEGLPLAPARVDRPEPSAAFGSATDDRIPDGTRSLPCGDADRVHRFDRRLPDLPALLPPRLRPGRRDQRLSGRMALSRTAPLRAKLLGLTVPGSARWKGARR